MISVTGNQSKVWILNSSAPCLLLAPRSLFLLGSPQNVRDGHCRLAWQRRLFKMPTKKKEKKKRRNQKWKKEAWKAHTASQSNRLWYLKGTRQTWVWVWQSFWLGFLGLALAFCQSTLHNIKRTPTRPGALFIFLPLTLSLSLSTLLSALRGHINIIFSGNLFMAFLSLPLSKLFHLAHFSCSACLLVSHCF